MKSGRAPGELRALTLIELLVVIVVIAILAGFLIPAYRYHPYKAMQAACESNLKQIGIAYRTWEGDYGDKYPQEMIATGNTNFPLGSDPTGYILNHPFPTNTAVGASLPYGFAYQCYQVMSNELNNPKIVLCPEDGRPIGSIPSDFINLPPSNTAAFNNSTVSYFVGADADETRPMMLLGGDRNVMMNGVVVVPGLVVLGTNTPIGWSAKMHNGKGNILFANGSVQRTTPSSLQTFLSNTGTNVNRLAVP
jgi:prepilin-type N-terminal cleavage/methylation domain-containing protein/prepilin-type processing-associated H-X9-DG protein